ncbi:hypothetical protein J1P26_22135 [Neobacillus sp. MM2021_6]|uniref:hypothetical protein n=1 Tax=Bacillaceae TaxID=186817 RepID=UPI00140E94D4|nr:MULTISPECIES: hypothetical protein [Bacillaceae]MBO0962405.1 hypothetical protein [Neobacillus sp. MM2021_6]NHC21026.1 hypothetical protein [Bacillus sp. MM2020_4]
MKSLKLSEIVRVNKPEYIFLKLTPNNSIRNQSTHKIAKSIASIYRNITHNIKKEDAKVIKFMKKEFLFGTKYSLEMNSKVSYYVYIEKKKVEFYFVIPKQHLTLIKEKISDSWMNITVKEVQSLPDFSETATKYQLVYSKENALSLATDRRNDDLLRSKLNVVDVMEEGDKVGVFYNFIPTTQFSWRSSYEATIRKVKRNLPTDRNKVGTAYILKMLIGVVSGLFDDLGEVMAGGKKKGEEHLFEVLIERLNGGKKISDATAKKATATVLNAQIVVMSESQDKLRQRNNARSLAQSFETITEDNRLIAKPYKKNIDYTAYSLPAAEVNKIGDEEAQNFISLAGRDILERYNFIEKVETQETQVPEELQKGIMRIGESTYRGHKQNAFLSTDKEFKYLSLILIGPNRAGKSTLIGNLSFDTVKVGECTIIFDYIGNCELSDEVAALFPGEKLLNVECDDFEKLQGLGYNEVEVSDDPFIQYDNAKKQTTQLMTLVNSINAAETHLSPKMERYLTSAALVVFITGGSIKDVFQVLQTHTARHKFLRMVPKSQYENLEESITSLLELDDYDKEDNLKGTKLNLIVGIIDRLNKLKANTYMELMLKKSTKNNFNLVEEMQKSQLICIRMPEHMFTTDNEKDVYTTYWMTKIWMALQMRKRKFKDDRDKMTKVNLVIDELYQVENTEKFLTTKLSRLPKFNIKPILSCHYLNQIKTIRPELRSASASYMLIAGCDKENFKELQDELKPYTLEDLMNLKRFHSLNLIKTKDGYGRFITKLPAPVSEQKEATVCLSK